MGVVDRAPTRVLQRFPLQNKKLQRLKLPYLQVGVCDVLNTDRTDQLDSFNAFNSKNGSLYAPHGEGGSAPFLGEMVAGGLFDSYTGPVVSRFVSSYLSRAMSLHTVVADELRAIRREFPDDPLLEVMKMSMTRHHSLHTRAGGGGASSASALRSLVTEWDMQQYALSADAALFRASSDLRRRWSTKTFDSDSHFGTRVSTASDPVSVLERGLFTQFGHNARDVALLDATEASGCRGVWFTATVAPVALDLQRRRALREAAQQSTVAPPPRKSLHSDVELARQEDELFRSVSELHPFCLDVVVSGVGSSRAFGLARSAFTRGSAKSVLDPTRERVVPLSVDHTPARSDELRRIRQAGGTVDDASGHTIDGNPFFNVSRSFGHRPMKSDPRASPVQQKMTALPTCFSWEMLAGDALVLCNHAVFETRQGDDTGVDEIAKLVGQELDSGSTPEQIASSVCDFAMRFGADHALQVMVAVATSKPSQEEADRVENRGASVPEFHEWVEPGPLYVDACRQLPELREAIKQDCLRCGLSFGELLALRYERVKDVLPSRHRLPLSKLYPKECGGLQQVMDEEANLFEKVMRDGPDMEQFHALASSLLKTRGGAK